MTVPHLSVPELEALQHGFFGRRGGVSTGAFASLNVGLGSGEDVDIIARNRELVRDSIAPGAQLLTVYQVHGRDCVIAETGWAHGERPHADAMASNVPGLLLGILTADCVPVLFADIEAGVVGAAHAGWKGAIAGVTDATLEAMEALGADRSRAIAGIGPCIAQESYEVDAGFRERFIDADVDNARWFVAGRVGHHQFDIAGYVGARLDQARIAQVIQIGHDTYSREAEYFSYRRACHRDEPDYGRQISVIGL